MVVFSVDYFAERHLRAAASGHENLVKLLRVLAEIARIANAHREALPAFDRGGQVLSADCGFNCVLDIGDIQAVSVRGGAIDGHLQIRRARCALGIEIDGAWNLRHNLLDLFRLGLNHAKIGTKDLDADLCADAGREHVDAIANRLRPDVGDAWNLQLLIEPGENRVLGEPLGPLVLWLEGDGRLAHVYRSGIGGGLGPSHFSNHHRDRRVGGNDLVLLTKNPGCLGERDARVGDGHEERGLFIERRHEL